MVICLFSAGTEFKNRLVSIYLRHEGIEMVHPSSKKKAAVVERFNRTIQTLIYKFMDHNQTQSYSRDLQHLVNTYNTRKHRTIGMTPHDAEKDENQTAVLNAHNVHYAKIASKRKKPKYTVGQHVLVKSLPSNRFHRGYQRSFNDEQFEIAEVKTNMPIPMYILKSLDRVDEGVILGGFYGEQKIVAWKPGN